jgi:hypothetical protein
MRAMVTGRTPQAVWLGGRSPKIEAGPLRVLYEEAVVETVVGAACTPRASRFLLGAVIRVLTARIRTSATNNREVHRDPYSSGLGKHDALRELVSRPLIQTRDQRLAARDDPSEHLRPRTSA